MAEDSPLPPPAKARVAGIAPSSRRLSYGSTTFVVSQAAYSVHQPLSLLFGHRRRNGKAEACLAAPRDTPLVIPQISCSSTNQPFAGIAQAVAIAQDASNH